MSEDRVWPAPRPWLKPEITEAVNNERKYLREEVLQLQHTWLLETHKMVKLEEVLKLLE